MGRRWLHRFDHGVRPTASQAGGLGFKSLRAQPLKSIIYDYELSESSTTRANLGGQLGGANQRFSGYPATQLEAPGQCSQRLFHASEIQDARCRWEIRWQFRKLIACSKHRRSFPLLARQGRIRPCCQLGASSVRARCNRETHRATT